MNRQKFSAIAHRDHDYCNPISAAKIERLLDLLPLDERVARARPRAAAARSSRCGSSSASARRSIAVDNSSLMLDAARERAEWTGALAQAAPRRRRHPRIPGRPRDVPPDGHAGRRRHRRRHGGHLQAAEGVDASPAATCWSAKATGAASRTPTTSRFSAARDGEYLDHRGNVQAGIDAGPHPDARDDGVAGRVGRVRMEVLPLDRALRARAARRSRRARDARAHPPMARRLPALGPRHAGLRVLLFYRPGAAPGRSARLGPRSQPAYRPLRRKSRHELRHAGAHSRTCRRLARAAHRSTLLPALRCISDVKCARLALPECARSSSSARPRPSRSSSRAVIAKLPHRHALESLAMSANVTSHRACRTRCPRQCAPREARAHPRVSGLGSSVNLRDRRRASRLRSSRRAVRRASEPIGPVGLRSRRQFLERLGLEPLGFEPRELPHEFALAREPS